MTTKAKTKKRTAVTVTGPAVLYVTYPGQLFINSTVDLDKQIDRAAKRMSCGSGMGNGLRDLHYDFRRMVDAQKAVARIKALHVRGLKVGCTTARQCVCGNLLPKRDQWCSCGQQAQV